MSTLSALQSEFQRAVTLDDPSFLARIAETGRVSAQQRVAIYSDAYVLRLIEVLEGNFPGLLQLLGSDSFAELARAYIASHPSTFRSIRWYGDRFADFIAQDSAIESVELLTEMARTDWVMGLVFDAADDTIQTESTMARFEPTQWGNLVFTCHASVHRLDLQYDVPLFRKSDDESDKPAHAPQRLEHSLAWVFWRQALTVRFRSMEVDEAFALDCARSGMTFAELCGGLTEWIDEQHVAPRAVGFLKRWFADEMISKVEADQV